MKTTQDKNAEIALWMGMKLSKSLNGISIYSEPGNGHTLYYGKESLKYHYDWNWLCLVIEKIRSTQECSDFNINFLGDCKIECEDYGKTFEEYCSNTVDTKQAVHEAVYQFIVWHNQQQEL